MNECYELERNLCCECERETEANVTDFTVELQTILNKNLIAHVKSNVAYSRETNEIN